VRWRVLFAGILFPCLVATACTQGSATTVRGTGSQLPKLRAGLQHLDDPVGLLRRPSHFDDTRALSRLLDDIAAPGPAGSRPYTRELEDLLAHADQVHRHLVAVTAVRSGAQRSFAEARTTVTGRAPIRQDAPADLRQMLEGFADEVFREASCSLFVEVMLPDERRVLDPANAEVELVLLVRDAFASAVAGRARELLAPFGSASVGEYVEWFAWAGGAFDDASRLAAGADALVVPAHPNGATTRAAYHFVELCHQPPG
jgi:hypothetical protein